MKRMKNLERVFQYTEATKELKRQNKERLVPWQQEKQQVIVEKREKVQTVKFEIDLYKGIKQKEIEEQKKLIVKAEKQIK